MNSTWKYYLACEHDFDMVCVKKKEGLCENTTVRGPGCDDQGRRCHEQCIGGCSAVDDPSSCHYCRNVNFDGECVESCPEGMLELKAPRRIRY